MGAWPPAGKALAWAAAEKSGIRSFWCAHDAATVTRFVVTRSGALSPHQVMRLIRLSPEATRCVSAPGVDAGGGLQGTLARGELGQCGQSSEDALAQLIALGGDGRMVCRQMECLEDRAPLRRGQDPFFAYVALSFRQ